jgi:hypothetical protein
MEAIPDGQASTRSARSKSVNKTQSDTSKVAARSRRGKVKAEPTGTALDSSELRHSIATTAYFLAAARNFQPGHELEDWLEAERQVRAAR